MPARALARLTAPGVTWPERARKVGLVCLSALATVVAAEFLLARFTPERALRLFDLQRSLPGALVLGLMLAGSLFFWLDSGRRLLVARRPAHTGLLWLLLVWALLAAAAIVWLLVYPSSVLFGSVG